MDQDRLEFLFDQYFEKTDDPAERAELMRFLQHASDAEISSLMGMAYYARDPKENLFSIKGKRRVHQIIQEKNVGSLGKKGQSKKKNSPPHYLFYWSIAAALLISITVAVLLFSPGIASRQAERPLELAREIQPGSDRAVLTLGDGTTIRLNEQRTGSVAQQAGTLISKTSSGSLVYEESGDLSDAFPQEVAYNIITIPRGGQYRVILPDGTKVWLNAGSSLRYPVRFNKEERLVELSGEGYFEVASNAKVPFKVRSANQTVQVTGTHFNVKAYPASPSIKTTLLEGSVEVTTRKNPNTDKRYVAKLKPGEQAVVTPANTMKVNQVNTTRAVAWKAGLFQFENTDIREVMHEFSRWYDVEVVFQGTPPPIKLWGRIYRNVNASEALEILKYFDLSYRIIQTPDKDNPREFNRKIIIYSL